MSMTIEEYIKHCESEIEECEECLDIAMQMHDTESAKENYNLTETYKQLAAWLRELKAMRELPEIVFCKDCARHNVDMRDSLYIEKAQECPLIHYRGKAQGHEFDYQFCVYAERRTDD